MRAAEIVKTFLDGMRNTLHAQRTLLVSAAHPSNLELSLSTATMKGSDWSGQIDQGERYDLIVLDLPLGMGKSPLAPDQPSVKVRRNWIDLWTALDFLDVSGHCIALVEPPAFGVPEGPRFLELLGNRGFHLNGVFNIPPGLLKTTNIRPVLVAISQERRNGLFVAELKDEEQAGRVATAFLDGKHGGSFSEGVQLDGKEFDGFESVKAKVQLNRLSTQYKEFKTKKLGEIAKSLNTVKSGDSFLEANNSIYIQLVGSLKVWDKLEDVGVKHHNVIQITLPESVKKEYLVAFFRSDLGLLTLRSVTRGAVIQRINKADIFQIAIAVPSFAEQEEIVWAHKKLDSLMVEIEELKKELAVNPKNSTIVADQLDGMLELIGGLTDSDRVKNLTREGESATVEFKESLSVDVRKGSRERYIEDLVFKTIAAFLNTKGGALLVGVNDSGVVAGIDEEVHKFHKGSIDKFMLHFKNGLKSRVGEQFYPSINQRVVRVDGKSVLVVDCDASPKACWLDQREFFVRTNPATDKLEGPKLVEYVKERFG
ncbi:ATP-binding protein [Thioalkalivibrio sp. AKL10]|uniref:ATP-binding protein n=1 Tax=Thioalkalivibrio sp. AKL10 TaxID=1158158 RepID=UPI00039E20F1|nr:RNA-binding domain-containing protein [Thioalkalivibrio sp. AKL10]